METIFKEVIKLYNESEYEKVATVIILLLFILLFRCFQKIFVDNRKDHINKDRTYKKALIRLLSCTINESNIKECYVLSEFATSEKKLNRIEYYIRTNNFTAIVEYIKEELYLLQDKEFTKYEGPESTALRKNLCKFKNCDKSDILERLENSRSDFFTVYNRYCNLSRFFGYQPAGMERSGMESG